MNTFKINSYHIALFISSYKVVNHTVYSNDSTSPTQSDTYQTIIPEYVTHYNVLGD